mmetsp:Transcript_17882/g.49585  ORF Transcript_17882/g.49585 Transcript_17882/m.49585 type:complete len:99 (-) Transcript_17882:351-647(-)
MIRITSILVVIVAIMATCNAFVVKPSGISANTAGATSTELSFGFLKELGIEKPDWLPDFGGKKDDAKEAPAADAPAEDASAPVEDESEPASEPASDDK